MTRDQRSINIAEIPQIREVAEEVRRTHRSVVLSIDNEEVAVLMPVATKRRRPRGRPLTVDDSLGQIVGIGEAEQESDVSENVDKYLAEAKLSQSR